MKKSLLTIAVTMALSSAVFSGSVLSTQAFAGATESVVNDNSKPDTTETYMYPGMGVGAATGALIAGPAGLIVGSIIGAIAGSSQDVSATAEQADVLSENTVEENTHTSEHAEVDTTSTAGATNPVDSHDAVSNADRQGIQLAQLGPINNIVDDSIDSQQDKLIDIMTADLSLDIYFRSGSDNIEAFYPARLAAIANLVNTMDQLELHLDGYSDRRGNKTKNIALSNQRIEKVRQQLIDAGVDENRIVSKAFGEMKMVSAAGDLEAYTFDRKVVIRFERITADSISTMKTALSEPELNDTRKLSMEAAVNAEVINPVFADENTAF